MKQLRLLRTIWLILIQSVFVKICKVCMTAGSLWLLAKVSTFNKYDNYFSMVEQYISCTNFPDNLIVQNDLTRLDLIILFYVCLNLTWLE